VNTHPQSRLSLSALSVASVLTLYLLSMAGLAATVFIRYGAQAIHSILAGNFPLPWLYEMWSDFYFSALLLSAFFIAVTMIVWLETRVSGWVHHHGELAYATRPIARDQIHPRRHFTHR
jgi:hypothetical protein